MPSNITAMTYNVRYDNPHEAGNDWRGRREEVAGVIRFRDPDLVGLQEARHTQVADLDELLDGYEWVRAGRREDPTAGELVAVGFDRGRFDRVADGSFWLSETPDEPGPGWDAMLPRLVRHVRLRERETGAELCHFNTHFDHDGETARRESAQLLLDRVDGIAPDAPVVVTGDLNCRPASAPHEHLTGRDEASDGRALRDAHGQSGWRQLGPTTTMTDFQNLVPDKKIDYVLASSDVDVVTHGVCSDTYDGGAYPSDHLPVVAEVSTGG